MRNIIIRRALIVCGVVSLGPTPASLLALPQAYAQSAQSCTAVEYFPHQQDYQRSQNLPELISNILGPSQSPDSLSGLKSNIALAISVRNDPEWVALGPMAKPEIIKDALNHIRSGHIVVASTLAADNSKGNAALITGKQLHSSSSWLNGTVAGVYFAPYNEGKSFAGCKLSFIWRSPENVQLHVYKKGFGEVVDAPIKQQNLAPELPNSDVTEATESLQSSTSDMTIPNPAPARPVKTQPPAPKKASYDGDPVYEADVILHDLKDKASLGSQDFAFDSCVFLHGSKGWVGEWSNLDEAERVDLAAFLTKVPTKKIRGAGDTSRDLDQFVIGPLCNCTSFSKTAKLAEEYNFEIIGILRDDNHKLKDCLR